MHDTARTANLLGAAALAVTDHALGAVSRAAGTGTSAAAALVVLLTSPELSVTELGRRVGLSQSAAARMVDSLQAAGLVERRPGTGREVRVSATSAGRDTAARLLRARTQSLSELVSVLDVHEQRALTELLTTLLTRLYTEIRSSEYLCRLCDRPSCTTNATCPVGQAERDRDG
ncbi:MarR family transcriptional regulator [Pseudonocardia sp. C8]|uniref:MarR family transcriptional regulator n=1 Tax=Pseudonocardia sp. C8 TaxID=2762759 RepID=UPI0016432ADD|nr:MarR family transcriptional regulator [Pseudonocardia sp. C8]MBC3192145.1 MarR family transcriptional regulator [Pseudonocardia sp. C8]